MSCGFATAISHSLLNCFSGFRAFTGLGFVGESVSWLGDLDVVEIPPRINGGKGQDPHRTSSPCSDHRDRQLLQRGNASRSTCTAPHGCSKCLGGMSVRACGCSVFYWEQRHLNTGRDALPRGRQGRGGLLPAYVCPTLCIQPAGPTRKQRAEDQPLQIVWYRAATAEDSGP